MRKRRVVVTGIGAVTPLGHSLAATQAALAGGRSAGDRATVFDASGFRCADAAEIRDWDARPYFRVPKALKLADRPARFAVAAAQMALDDGGWPRESEALDRLGVAIGSSGSDLQMRDIGRALAHDPDARAAEDVPFFADRVLNGLNPLWLLISLPNMTSAHVAIQVQARGPNTTIMSDWAAGQQAIGEAAEWIRAGDADAVLAGGADCGVQPLAYMAYEQAGLFAESPDEHCRFVPGEGAALFLLEDRDAALARGATIRAEVHAYAVRGGCRDTIAGALARTLRDAIDLTGWTAGSVCACGVAAPSTPAYQRAVEQALAIAFGDSRVPLLRFDGMGHALAAAGPIEAALMIQSTGRGCVLGAAIGSSGEAVALAFERGAAQGVEGSR